MQIIGPSSMMQSGNKVELTFMNAQYAGIFFRKHTVRPINALSDDWPKYYNGQGNEPEAGEVLQFLDTFAGQENTAEEVRDFVQKAARFIDENRTADEWRADAELAMFMEWRAEQYAAEEVKYDRDGPR